MRIIAVSTLKRFARDPNYADAHDPMMAWARQVMAADWSTPAELKRDIRTASILQDGRAVFNVAGNKYRIVVWINSNAMLRSWHHGCSLIEARWISNPSNPSGSIGAL